jgi:hypothetical protein
MDRTDRGWLAFFPLTKDVKPETPQVVVDVEDAAETELATQEL